MYFTRGYGIINSDSFVKVLYTKKDKFATKKAFVQYKNFPQPQKLYTDMPAIPVTNSRSGRAGHFRMRTREAVFLGFSPSDILVDRTRVSALHICPISQHTFFSLIF